MMRCTLIVMAVLMTLAGCRESVQDPEEVRFQSAGNGGGVLHFSYPVDGQESVAVTAPLLLRFSDGIETPVSNLSDSVVLRNGQGGPVALESFQLVGDDRGLRAEPEQPLAPGRTYELTVSGLEVGGGLVNAEVVEFTTSRAEDGAVSHRDSDDQAFRVRRFVPYGDPGQPSLGDGTGAFPISDMASLRLAFTRPAEESTLTYGETVRLMDSDGDLVPARLWAKGRRLTVDPQGDLEAGATYALHLNEGIRSRNDDRALQIPEDPWRFTPVASESPTGERARMPQRAVMMGGHSALSGAPVNSVGLSSTLLGENNRSTQEGLLFADLGFIPRFDHTGRGIPLRVEQGTLIEGSNVDVRVGGKVPAGFSSGNIDVRFLSDANGYLLPNPYSSKPDAPRVVRLFMDIALNTEGNRANGALAQSLMHVELVGTALVEEGVLTLKAVSVIEPEVMGLEEASGLISFRLEKLPAGGAQPSQSALEDRERPELRAWDGGAVDRGEPIRLLFSEALAPETVTGSSVQLRDASGDEVPARVRQDGPNLYLKPDARLTHGATYEVALEPTTLMDLAGNPLEPGEAVRFTVPATEPAVPTDMGPFALTTRPGYPCAKADLTSATFEAGEGNGRCLGGMTEEAGDQTSQWMPYEKDDRLPLESLASDEPITVRFSQPMDPDSITPESVVVEQWTGSGWQAVDVALDKGPRSVRAVPETPWQVDGIYRYTLTDAITSTEGIPLYTRLLSQYQQNPEGRSFSGFTAGGHDLVNRFRVKEPDERTMIPLSNRPTRDINANLEVEPPEKPVIPDSAGQASAAPNSAEIRFQEGSTETSMVRAVNVGCRPEYEDEDYPEPPWDPCPADKFIYQLGALDIEVLPGESGTGTGVPVEMDPSVLMTSPLSVYIYVYELILAQENPNQEIPAGPMVLRMRYAGEDRDQPISGTIRQDGSGQLIFETELDVYLDAPYMSPDIRTTDEVDHNLRSFKLDDLKLKGPIRFTKDGRMRIEQRNTETVELKRVRVDGNFKSEVLDDALELETSMILEISKGELYLDYVSPAPNP